MNLFITNEKMPPLCGIVIQPKYLALQLTHLTLASQTWDTLYIDVEESIPEGSLRFLSKKCKNVRVSCPEHPSKHQMHLLIELYPVMDGRLRKAFMKGDSISGILPEMWKHGTETGRDAV